MLPDLMPPDLMAPDFDTLEGYFINWGTTRKPWREHCEVTGNVRSAARFLDVLNIV